MASIPIAISRQVAIDRLIEVMQATYATKLADIQDVGLHLPAPQDAAYYYALISIDELTVNRNPAVFIYPTQRRVLESRSSNGPLGHFEMRTFQLTVATAFKAGAGKKFQRNGKTVTTDDIMWLRAERYTGAMAHIITEYACDDNAIHQIDLVDDMADVIPLNDGKMMGVAATTWKIDQKILMPRSKPLPTP